MLGRRHYHTAVTLAVVALGAGLACRDVPTAREPGRAALEESTSGSGTRLLKCSTQPARSASGWIDAAGGEVKVVANRLAVPAGAVGAPTLFGLAVPGSTRVQIDLTANGEEHFTFAAPVVITIDLARCTTAELGSDPLSVWYIDETTGALLQHMGGTYDAASKTITFTTDHFSSYAVAH